MAIALAHQTSANFVYNTVNPFTVPATTIGNLLIAAIRRPATGITITSITGGGTWVQAVANSIGNNGADIWYCFCTSSVTTVTVNTNANINGGVLNISEWSGMQVTGTPTDGTNSGVGNNSGSTGTTGTITPTASTSVLIIAVGDVSGVITSTYPVSGYTPFSGSSVPGSGASLMADYQIVASASGSYSVQYRDGYVKYAECIAAFKASGGAPPTVNSNFFMFF